MTIVIPLYNGERFIPRTLDSVLAQTLIDWEVVVVDDGSTHDQAPVLEPYLADPRIRVVRQPNGGLANARNSGYRESTPGSPYLLFLDADDCLEPEMLDVLTGHLERNPSVGIAFSERTLIDEQDNVIPALRDDHIRRYVPSGRWLRMLAPDEPDTPFESLFAYSIVVPSLTVIRRSAFEEAGGWDERIAAHYEDTDLWLRITLRRSAHYIPRALLRRRLHGDQMTRNVEGERRRRLGESRFAEKWAQCAWLAPPDRSRVEAARRFRERRVLPYLWLGWARERMRRREPVAAAKCVAHAMRHLFATPANLARSRF